MQKKRPVVKLIVFAVLTVLVAFLGSYSGLLDSLKDMRPEGPGLANLAGVALMVFATLTVEYLVLLILSFLKPKKHRARTAVSLAANIVRYIAAIVILCGVLAMLNVDIGAILAGLGIVALIIGFGAESLISDVVTGTFILLDNQYNVGDIIEVGGFRGTVSDIGIRTTCVTDGGGNVKIINNSDMKNILNRSDNISRATADFPIPYETDLTALEQKLPALLDSIFAAHRNVFLSAPRYYGVQELADSAVLLRFVAEVGEADIYTGKRILNRDLLVGLRRLGVECPFPQVDVHTK